MTICILSFEIFQPCERTRMPFAAEAAEAAAAQGKFWEMHDELVTHQQALEDNDLSRYAKRIGLDVARFARDISENSFLKKIEAEYQSALFD